MCRGWRPPGADGGTDIIAHPDALGIKKPTNKVSVRCRETKADVSDPRQFISQVHGNDVGIYFFLSLVLPEKQKRRPVAIHASCV